MNIFVNNIIVLFLQRSYLFLVPIYYSTVIPALAKSNVGFMIYDFIDHICLLHTFYRANGKKDLTL